MREILLANSRGIALADDADFEDLMQYRWIHVHGYAYRCEGRKTVMMHRHILGVTDRRVSVDHIDANKLNNTRSNLRLCNQSQNCANNRKKKGTSTSLYKGVIYDARRGLWRAEIKVNYRAMHLGRFSTEVEAAMAYDAAAILHFGEFARPNLPQNRTA